MIHKRARMYAQWNERWPVYVCGSCLSILFILHSWMAPCVDVFECEGNLLLPFILAVWINGYCWMSPFLSGVNALLWSLRKGRVNESGRVRGNLGWVCLKCSSAFGIMIQWKYFCGRLLQDIPPSVWNKSILHGGVWLMFFFFKTLFPLKTTWLLCCCLRIFHVYHALPSICEWAPALPCFLGDSPHPDWGTYYRLIQYCT